MMMWICRLIVVSVAMLLFTPTVYAKDNVALTSYYIPGLVDNPQRGVMVDMLRALEQQSDLSFQLTLMPTARVQQSFVKNRIYSYFPELEEFRPVNSCRTASFMKKAIIAVNLKGKPPISHVSQLEGLRVGAVTGYSYGKAIVKNPAITLERVDNDKTNLQKLLAGRIDAIAGDIHSTVNAIKELQLEDKVNVDIDQPVALLDVFFVFQNTTQGKAHCEKVSTAIEKLRKQGDLFNWFGYR